MKAKINRKLILSSEGINDKLDTYQIAKNANMCSRCHNYPFLSTTNTATKPYVARKITYCIFCKCNRHVVGSSIIDATNTWNSKYGIKKDVNEESFVSDEASLYFKNN